MATKLTEWRLKMTDGVNSVLSRLNSAADTTSSKFSKLQNTIQSDRFREFSDEIPGASRGLGLLSSKAMLVGASVALAGTVMAKSTQLALDYEKGMAKINATAQLTPSALSAVKSELIDIGKHSGGNFERIPDAFEKINSSLNNVNKSMAVLKVANKAAQAGFVDIDLAAGALAQTVSILGNRATATQIADVMFGAKRAGNAEFQDFASYLPQLIASADTLNIAYQDIAGAFAFMTGKFDASTSTMLLQNMMTAMGKSEIQKGFEKAGIKMFNKDGTMRDLDAFFSDLHDRLDGMSAQNKSNFLEAIGLRDSQAKQAFSAMAGEAGKLRDIMNDVRKSAGEMNVQLEMTANHSRTWGEIGDQLKSWGVAIGDFLLPIVDHVLQAIQGVGEGLSKMFQKSYWQGFEAPEQMESKRNMARAVAQREAENSFLERFGFTVDDKSKKFNREHSAFFQSKYQQMYAAIMGEEYSPAFTKKEKPKSLSEADQALIRGKQKSSLKSGIDGINEGGRNVRNINVYITKMVEKFEVHAATIKESGPQVVAHFEEQLLRAINGAELSLTNE